MIHIHMNAKSPAQYLSDLITKPSRLICGVMSGTSIDGIDVAFVRISGSGISTRLHIAGSGEIPFEKEVREMIKRNSEQDTGSVQEICVLNSLLALVYADAIQSAARSNHINLSEIDLIGLHGQTIHHLPIPKHISKYSVRSTLQIGNGPTLAALMGIPVVSDFRSADMAMNGQGAPLVPYFDYLLFKSDEKDRILCNVGGIANITFLKRGCSSDEIVAFDTGPGNMIIDALMRHYYQKPFDRNGEVALSGKVNEFFLTELLKHEYFSRPFPKSTGRELFGQNYAQAIIRIGEDTYHLDSCDVIATISQLTVASIVHAVRQTVDDNSLCEIILSGGGAKNNYVLNNLKNSFSNVSVKVIDEFGIPADAKEAICFAVFANEWLFGNAINVPSVTGAVKKIISGTFSYA